MFTSRVRQLLFFVVLFFIPLTFLMLLSNQTNISYTEMLERRVSELEERLHQAEQTNELKLKQLTSLQGMLKSMNFSSLDNHSLQQPNVVHFFQNLTQSLQGLTQQDTGYTRYLPHLANAAVFRPAVHLSAGRSGVLLSIGIPTVHREKKSYLMETVRSVLDAMSDDERRDTIIVIMAADAGNATALQVIGELKRLFPSAVSSGLIEVISPSKDFYPDLSNLPLTLGDPLDRVQWRSKQVLDFVYLMHYCRSKTTYYLQLEDDVISKQNFVSSIKSFATRPGHWIYLSFSSLGFIGKLFKSQELYRFVDFLLMFWSYKPVDWLLDQYLSVMVCNPDKPAKNCWAEKAKVAPLFKPSLFQHVGQYSSLNGKIQRLKDRNFGKISLYQGHGNENPSADVSTSLKQYKTYSIQKAYVGESFFWALNTQPGDTIIFSLHPVIKLKQIKLKSGNPEHPDDVLMDTSVEVEPAVDSTAEQDKAMMAFKVSADGFFRLGNFTEVGDFEFLFPSTFPAIRTVRLYCHSESKNWVILSEILLKPLS